jgi:3-phosphoshikimate 1-carboxyvinyltransferase
LSIKGNPIPGGKAFVDMTQSSQYASSLLLAAPMFPQGLELELVGELNSLPYLDMTLAMMCHFSAQAERHGRTVVVQPKPYESQSFTIEPDWTAASYWYEMAAFSEECEIRLRVLDGCFCLQGDSLIAEWMTRLGVGTFIEGEDLVLRKIPFERRSLHFDFSQHPDLYPTMAATCAGLQMEAAFTGLDNLVLKESNRVEAMQAELSKLGHHPLRFSAHNDHRIVMALAPLAMLFGPVTFDHPEVVAKSYPGFWSDAAILTKIG